MSGDGFAVNEDYWERLEDEVDDDVPDTVLDRIVDQLDPERIHGIEFHGMNGKAYYGVVAYSGRQNGMDVLDLRTVVVDLRDDHVKVHDNGLWIPRFEGAAGALTSVVARASSEIDGSIEDDEPPLMTSAINTSAESILSHEIEDDYVPEDGDGWGKTWGNGQGPPPEIDAFVDRLEQADVPTDRFSQLVFGEKVPNERYGNRGPREGIYGNYGVETGVPSSTDEAGVDGRVLENDPLVIVDVDDPEAAPLEEIPETYAVSSASGSDERAHHYFRVPDKEAVYDYYGTWAVKPGWGDVWVAGEYVVGPGCKTEDGTYDVVTDVPLATLSSDELIDLCEQGPDDPTKADDRLEELEQGGPDRDDDLEPEPVDAESQVTSDEDEDEDDREVECHDCGASIDPSAADLVDRDGSPAYVCPGGECDE